MGNTDRGGDSLEYSTNNHHGVAMAAQEKTVQLALGWDGVERTGNGEMEEREGEETNGIWWSLDSTERGGTGEDYLETPIEYN